MKRWQTRGEVQDSDEEELSLEANSHGLEYPPKRTKIDESPGSNQDGDQTKTTPSTLPGHEQVESVAQNGDATEAENTDSPDILNTPGHFDSRDDDKEPDWTTRTSTKTYGRLQRVPRQDAGKARELFPVITQAEQIAVDVANMHTVLDMPSSSNPPEDAPAAQQEATVINQIARPTTPSMEHSQTADPMSIASSPLSELSNPPESPPDSLRFVASSRIQSQAEQQLPAASHFGEASDLVDHDLRTALLTQGARRSLRARQEKQLHPYMYDKAQYQQQCRERGLRPIRLIEQISHDTQDESINHDQDPPSSSATRPSSSSSSLGGLLSSAVALNDSFTAEPNQPDSLDAEDDLPDMDRLIQSRAVAGRLHSRKRQKFTHPTTNRGNVVAHAEHGPELEDVFGVPPSPPASSRGSAPRIAKAPKGFRLPHGMSPKPLLTPQISSDIRPSHGYEVTALSDEDTPPRTSRRIARVRSTVTIGSDSSVESEPGSEDDQKLLSRERRRIRGVLPASWLKIDRKARPVQKPVSPEHSEHDSTPRAAPQKGVARKIHKRSTAALGLNVLEISDGDEAQASDDTTAITPRMPPTAANNPERAIRLDDDVDVDDMEVDWFDPMLAGAARVRRSPKSTSKRQSRITGTSKKQSTLDFSEERNGLRHQRGVDPPKQRDAARKARGKTRQRKSPPHLGILDAPRSPAGHGSVEPQFVRLAARQARQALNHGRQSPSRKVIRLATREDTEQANSTLQNWKRGAIPQRPSPEIGRGNVVKGRGIAQPSPRTPLADVTDKTHNTTTTHSVPPNLTFTRTHGNAITTQLPSKEPSRYITQGLPQQRLQHARTGTDTPRRPVQKKAALQTARYRDAQLETHESVYMQQNRSVSFDHRIQCLTEAVARRSSTPTGEVQVRRFLHGPDPVPRALQNPSPDDEQEQEQDHAQARPAHSVSDTARLPHRSRKRRTQRLDVETRQYRQPSEPLPEFFASHILNGAQVVDSGLVLRGLGPSGTRYATDFDISRLPPDTYFAESTFIGSGQLTSALALDHRTLDHGFGSLRIYISGNVHEWTAWSEEVSAAMAAIPKAISSAIGAIDSGSSSQHTENIATVTSNVDHMLHSTIRYLSKCLRFSDAIDSKACCHQLVQVVQDLLEISEESDKWISGLQGLRQRILQSALVLARQNQIIGDHAAVPLPMRAIVRDRVLRIASRLASHLIPGNLDELRSAYEEQRMSSVRELGIRRDDSALAGIVILHHCMRGDHNPRSLFWEAIEKALSVDPSKMLFVPEIDATWYSITTILPCLDFDSAGIIQNPTATIPESDWSLPTRLVERCLSLYDATCTVRGSSINEYIRATLARCSNLFTMWHWWKCETLLSTMYDFFARRNLSLLYREEGKGSPDFLEHLTCSENISLEAAADDRSFSIYLKLLAASLRTWRQHRVYSDKKIGGIAWRIIPNHARIYLKDSEVKQADLDALRNHFDLLCTLYFASPQTHRLRVDMLRNLVDHATSHREACRISVRAWSRLASFQMSTEESTDKLEPFTDWFKEMTLMTVAQYRFARTEAEQQYAEAKAAGVSGLSDEMLETTIASNQRQIAATLVDLLAAFRRALMSASGVDAARVLLERCEPWRAFESFDPSERRLTTVYNEALELFRATIDVQRRFEPALDSEAQSEDSQDYGDFSVLQWYATGQVNSGPSDIVALVQNALAHMVSNAFGSEVAPDDILLARLIDVWVQSAKHLVSKGLRSWGNFVGEYAGAWSPLRDTTQHRKFTPYLLAKVLEADPEVFDALEAVFMSAWLKCLVDRESTLKYQHLLTAALLNAPLEEPILQNLPFSKTSSTAEYRITLPELRQRRLGVISSVFSNMLQHYNLTMLERPRNLPGLGRYYADLFSKVMQAMKSNYQDLQLSHSNNTADSTVQGAYVIFVQEVVGFLQQYAIEGICTVDRFFLDSSAFPLPVDDPTYVVGKLKKHVSGLAEARTRKQLATFIHNISERAALDQQQPYLTDQMHRAMSGTVESGDSDIPSLRHVIFTSIIPAYLDNVIDDNVSWVLALPMIEASKKTVANLLYDTDLESEDGVAVAIEQVGALLSSVQKSLARLTTDRQRLSLPHVLKTVAAMLNLCHASVVFANHVQRVTKRATAIVRQLRVLQNQGTRIEEQLSTPEDFFDFIADDIEDDQPALRWPDTYEFSEKQVKQSMASDWSVVDERYFVKRGNGSREVIVQVDGFAEERDGLLEAIGNFRSICRRQATRGRRSRTVDQAFGMDGLRI